MDLNELTVGQLQELRAMLAQMPSGIDDKLAMTPFPLGAKVLIRTVTVYHVGTVSRVSGGFVYLTSASWVADTGRFGQAIASGSLNEVEFVGPVAVSLASVVDVFPWNHDLPGASK